MSGPLSSPIADFAFVHIDAPFAPLADELAMDGPRLLSLSRARPGFSTANLQAVASPLASPATFATTAASPIPFATAVDSSLTRDSAKLATVAPIDESDDNRTVKEHDNRTAEEDDKRMAKEDDKRMAKEDDKRMAKEDDKRIAKEEWARRARKRKRQGNALSPEKERAKSEKASSRLQKKALSARESRKRKKIYLTDLERRNRALADRLQQLELAGPPSAAAERSESKLPPSAPLKLDGPLSAPLKLDDPLSAPFKLDGSPSAAATNGFTSADPAVLGGDAMLASESRALSREILAITAKMAQAPAGDQTLLKQYADVCDKRRAFLDAYMQRLAELVIPPMSATAAQWILAQGDQYLSTTDAPLDQQPQKTRAHDNCNQFGPNLFGSLLGEVGGGGSLVRELFGAARVLVEAQNRVSAAINSVRKHQQQPTIAAVATGPNKSI